MLFIKNNKLLLLLVGSLLSIVFALICLGAYVNYQDSIANAKTETNNIALVLEQYITGKLSKFDQLALRTQDIFALKDAKKMSMEQISRELYRVKQFVPEIDYLAITDKKGEQIGNSAWMGKDGQHFQYKPVNIGDREHFIRHLREPNTELVISEPIIARTNGNLVVSLVRKRMLVNNHFNGVVLAVVNLHSFSDFFTTLDPGKNGTISVRDAKQILVARYPFDKNLIGTKILLPEKMEQMIGQGINSGNIIDHSRMDSMERLYSFRVLRQFPFMVTVAKSKKVILHAWYRQTILIFIFFFLFFLLSLWSILYFLKTLEANQQQSIHMAQLSVLGSMSASIAHEINNPLGIIAGRALQLKRSLENPKNEREKLILLAQQISEYAERISKIVKGLRSFARNSEQDPFMPVAVRTLMAHIFALVEPRLKAEGVEWRYSECSPGLYINCREAQLEQVMLNLISNSLDAMHGLTKKWVEVKIEARDESIIFSVIDSGAGIPSSIADKLMKSFFTTKGKGKGTGLGLHISRQIVESHQGRLWLNRSTTNTCFVIEFPRSMHSSEDHVAV